MERRFKDDWNVNKDFLMYCMDIIKRMGFYRAENNPYSWYIASSELYAIVGTLIDKKAADRLKTSLIEIQDVLNSSNISSRTKGGQRLIQQNIAEALTKLDEFQKIIIGGMHTARLILPRSDKRTGLKRLEEDFGIGGKK